MQSNQDTWGNLPHSSWIQNSSRISHNSCYWAYIDDWYKNWVLDKRGIQKTNEHMILYYDSHKHYRADLVTYYQLY